MWMDVNRHKIFLPGFYQINQLFPIYILSVFKNYNSTRMPSQVCTVLYNNNYRCIMVITPLTIIQLWSLFICPEAIIRLDVHCIILGQYLQSHNNKYFEYGQRWKTALREVFEKLDEQIIFVEDCRLVGIYMLVFAKASLTEYITNVNKHVVGTGIMGFLGLWLYES